MVSFKIKGQSFPGLDLLLYLSVFALFMLFTGFRLFADGMFVDGVTYATLSRNLAEGTGSFWEPFLTATLYPQFHEHPPLAIWMQSLAFRIFGDHLLVERFYSLATFLITGFLIVLIWKEITGERKSGWIPLLAWILFPLVSWAAASNLLDNTLSVFTTLAILLILKSFSLKNQLFLVFAGLSLFAGLLSKGPFALFPWVLPFLWTFRQQPFNPGRATIKTLILLFSTLAPLVILTGFSAAARESLQMYWTNQVSGSLEGAVTVTSRLYILKSLGMQLIVPVAVAAVLVLLVRPGKIMEKTMKYNRTILLLMLLGLSGVVPIMISLKQSSFYILAAMPVFALVIALPVRAAFSLHMLTLYPAPRHYSLLLSSVFCLLLVSLLLPPVLSRHSRRDLAELQMIRQFSQVIPSGTTIRIDPLQFTDWSLHSYFARLSQVSLDPAENPAAGFYLSKGDQQPAATDQAEWVRVEQVSGFVLFRKIPLYLAR